MATKVKHLKEDKVFQYTITFTVESEREMTEEEVVSKAEEQWDRGHSPRSKFTDSYGFEAERTG